MLKKENILKILDDWNFWSREIDTGVERTEYLEKMNNYFETGMIVSLIGIRRSGKSTLLLQFAKKLIEKNKFSKNEILYVNFEDARFLGEYSTQLLQDIYETYLENLKPKNNPVIFLDEVQNIPGWEKFANSLYERKAASIFVSGSSAYLLKSELSSVLTGRQLALTIYPLGFKEFLLFHNIRVESKLDLLHQKTAVNNLLDEFMKYGGLPKVVLIKGANEKETLLRNYFDDILNRDLIGRFKIRQIEKLRTLAKFYLSNSSSLISFNKIKNFLKIPYSTIERFSEYFSYPFLLYFVPKFSFSIKEQAVNPRKIYIGDLGIKNSTSFSFSEDSGKLLENLVFLNLLGKEAEIYYYKTKNNLEVDFLIKEKQRVRQLIQVCVTLGDFKTREREIKSLTMAMDELNVESGLIITKDGENFEEISNSKIKVISVCEWLLNV